MQRFPQPRPAPGRGRWRAGWLRPLALLLLLLGGAARPGYGQADIARAEYYIDADPGFGAATAFALPATAAADLPNLSATVPLGALTPGFHALGVRSQDATGAWSLTSRRVFYYEPAALATSPNVNKVEYFIDTDPGFGAATDVPVTAATDVSGVAFNVALSGLSTGFHALGLRSRDANGQWSLTSRRVFYYEPAAQSALPNINKTEYFVDTDPGFGSAIDVPVTAAADISGIAFNVAISGLSTGFHQLGVRSRNANGQWSLTNRRVFYYEPTALATLPNITRAEYFVDTDPGFGTATNIPIATPAADLSGLAFTVSIGSLSTGFHQLGIRSQDATGAWSLTSRRVFYYEPAALAALPNITKTEYFIDTDPGFGSGVDVPVTAAPDVSGVAFAVALGSLPTGFHYLSVRSRDANGKWSLTNARAFYYEPVLAVAPNVNKIEYYFDTDPGFGSATDVPVATPAPDLANFGFVADASALPDGAHRVFIRSRDANGKWSLVSRRDFVKNGCASSTNFAAGLPAADYTASNAVGSAAVAFNTNPATPSTANAPYVFSGGYVQADLGTAQTVSEVRATFVVPTATNFTLLVQTAPAAGGPYTTVDTYAATFATNTVYPVVRTLTTPAANVRGLRLVLQNASGTYVLVAGAGAYYFNCSGPIITSFTPTGGAGGTSVTLTGTNLSGATGGPFNDTAATTFNVRTATTATATVPLGTTTGNVTITTGGAR